MTVYGADTHDGVAGIWMELLEGDTLDEILARDGVWSATDALFAGIDLANALSAVHGAGLLHRDVKARNVVRERAGRLVLMDLGAGRAAQEVSSHGDGMGTPLYMAPEVLAGSAASIQSDIYGLGVLLFRLLTGEYPVSADDLDGLHEAHRSHRRALRDRRPDLPAIVGSTIERACHADRDERHASAADLEAALAGALARVLNEGMPIRSAAGRWWMRWRTAVLALAVTVAASLLLVHATWNTASNRRARRALGLSVSPVSTLYLDAGALISAVRGDEESLVPFNSQTAQAISVDADGIHTLAGIPPWVSGARFSLDGTPVAAPRAAAEGLCCFTDGTTDGEFNYAPRRDDTSVSEGRGSRPLAPPALYRFSRDWMEPRELFALTPGASYQGVAYSTTTRTFWLARNDSGQGSLEEWSREGTLLGTPVRMSAARFLGVAADPADGTLWVIRGIQYARTVRLENFDSTGRHLGSFDVDRARTGTEPMGAEFAWSGTR